MKLYEVVMTLKVRASSVNEALEVASKCSSATTDIEELHIKKEFSHMEEVQPAREVADPKPVEPEEDAAEKTAVQTATSKTAVSVLAGNLMALWKKSGVSLECFLKSIGLNGRTPTDVIGEAYRIRTADLEKLARLLNVSPAALVTEGTCDKLYVDPYPDSTNPLTMVLACNIIDYRHVAGFSEDELATRSGVSVIDSLEDGCCVSIGVYRVERIADALGVRVADLFAYRAERKERIKLPEQSWAVQFTAAPETLETPKPVPAENPAPKPAPAPVKQEPKPVNTILAENVINFRAWKGWSQKTFAQLVKSNQGSISQFERGLWGTTLGTLLKFAKYMNVHPVLLLTQGVSGRDLAVPDITFPEDKDFVAVIGKNLNQFRTKRKLTLSGLSKKAGVCTSQLWSLENCKGRNTLLTGLDKIAAALNVTVADFLKE